MAAYRRSNHLHSTSDLNAGVDEAQPMNRAMNLTDWALLLSVAALLGSSFLFLNIAVQEIPPLTSAAVWRGRSSGWPVLSC